MAHLPQNTLAGQTRPLLSRHIRVTLVPQQDFGSGHTSPATQGHPTGHRAQLHVGIRPSNVRRWCIDVLGTCFFLPMCARNLCVDQCSRSTVLKLQLICLSVNSPNRLDAFVSNSCFFFFYFLPNNEEGKSTNLEV